MRRTRLDPHSPEWVEVPVPEALRLALYGSGASHVKAYRRPAGDGDLRVFVAKEPPNGWHLSISHPRRYPTWDEIADARYSLAPPNITMAMLLPPPSEYVNAHKTTFHLHEVASG